MPSWLYWTMTAIHFLPGLLIGLAVGWYLIKPVNAGLGWFFRAFNRLFDHLTNLYGRVVGWFLKLSVVVIVIYGGMLLLTGWQFATAPVGFVPQQDKGYLILTVQLQDAASLERTNQVMAQLDKVIRGQKDGGALQRGCREDVGGLRPIAHHQRQCAEPGLDVRPAEELPGPPRPVRRRRLRAELLDAVRRKFRRPLMSAFGGPPIDGLGTTGGFKLIIENRGNLAPEELDKVTSTSSTKGTTPGCSRDLFSTSRADTPWLNLELDRSKCLALGVQVTDVFNTLQVYVGSYYVNNFNQFGRTWQVNVQADANFRNQIARHQEAPSAQSTRTNDSAGLAARRSTGKAAPWR